MVMTTRVQTGIDGLDRILCGGFLRHNSILLKGAPGTGKTSLGIQILMRGILEDSEAGIVCSFEQFPQQLYRDALAFGWNLEQDVHSGRLAVFFMKPIDLMCREGSPESPLLTQLFEKAEAIGAGRILIDSVSHFIQSGGDPGERRGDLLRFINALKAAGLTPILTAEAQQCGLREYSFEEYLVDEVVLLHNESGDFEPSLPRRTLEIIKTRGHEHVRGRHPFVFGPHGIDVYPHILPASYTADEMADSGLEPVSTGVEGIDGFLGGGYLRGTVAIVAGMSGTYKTTLAASFLADGAKKGEKGLLVTFEEMPRQMTKMLAGRGVDLVPGLESGLVEICHYVPKECCLDAIYADLRKRLEGGLRRVVVDSLDGFERSIDNTTEYRDYLGMFLAALRRAGATTLLTQKLQHVSTNNPLADIRYASMTDTIVYLGNVEFNSEIHKVISILKSRGANPDTSLREIFCDGTGLHVSHKFHGLSGILQGNAHGQFKKTVEDVFQPLYYLRDFAQIGAGAEGIEAKKAIELFQNMLGQIESLDEALKDHFGFDPEKQKLR
jgi:circadian clock protein KaiC